MYNSYYGLYKVVPGILILLTSYTLLSTEFSSHYLPLFLLLYMFLSLYWPKCHLAHSATLSLFCKIYVQINKHICCNIKWAIKNARCNTQQHTYFHQWKVYLVRPGIVKCIFPLPSRCPWWYIYVIIRYDKIDNRDSIFCIKWASIICTDIEISISQ